jgi:hypothetical protein
MKLNGTIRMRGTITWCSERERFVLRGFTFDDTDPALIEFQGDDAKLFAIEDCTFNRSKKR